jgi:hypothetical protein
MKASRGPRRCFVHDAASGSSSDAASREPLATASTLQSFSGSFDCTPFNAKGEYVGVALRSALSKIPCKPLGSSRTAAAGVPRPGRFRPAGADVPSAAREGLQDTILHKSRPNAGEGACAPDPRGIFILKLRGRNRAVQAEPFSRSGCPVFRSFFVTRREIIFFTPHLSRVRFIQDARWKSGP